MQEKHHAISRYPTHHLPLRCRHVLRRACPGQFDRSERTIEPVFHIVVDAEQFAISVEHGAIFLHEFVDFLDEYFVDDDE